MASDDKVCQLSEQITELQSEIKRLQLRNENLEGMIKINVRISENFMTKL